VSGPLRRRDWAGAVLLLALTVPPLARAEFYSGNEILSALEAGAALSGDRGRDFYAAGLGTGFVAGVWDAYTNVQFLFNAPLGCPPAGVTLGQVTAIALKYLRANPERLHMTAESLLREAFSQAFPCLK
jgi:hypothetical protein